MVTVKLTREREISEIVERVFSPGDVAASAGRDSLTLEIEA
jgi:hypothetical protein